MTLLDITLEVIELLERERLAFNLKYSNNESNEMATFVVGYFTEQGCYLHKVHVKKDQQRLHIICEQESAERLSQPILTSVPPILIRNVPTTDFQEVIKELVGVQHFSGFKAFLYAEINSEDIGATIIEMIKRDYSIIGVDVYEDIMFTMSRDEEGDWEIFDTFEDSLDITAFQYRHPIVSVKESKYLCYKTLRENIIIGIDAHINNQVVTLTTGAHYSVVYRPFKKFNPIHAGSSVFIKGDFKLDMISTTAMEGEICYVFKNENGAVPLPEDRILEIREVVINSLPVV